MAHQAILKAMKQFCIKLEYNPHVALRYLEMFNWDLNRAVSACLKRALPTTGVDLQWYVWNKNSEAEALALLQGIAQAPPGLGLSSLSVLYDIEIEIYPSEIEAGAQMASSQVNDSRILNRLKNYPSELDKEELVHAFCGVAVGTSTLDDAAIFAAIDYLRRCHWIIIKAIEFFYGQRSSGPLPPQSQASHGITMKEGGSSSSYPSEIEAVEERIPVPQMASSQVNVCRILNVLKNFPAELDKEELIHAFCDVAVGTSRDAALYAAITYLECCHLILNNSLEFFYHQPTPGPLSPQSQASHGITMKEGRSSSSLTNADPAETGRLVKEAGEENIRAATRRFALSQVNGKAVDEDSSTKAFLDDVARHYRIIRTIPLTIEVADGRSRTSITPPFKPDATVMDICEAIAEINQANNKDYYLVLAESGEQYMDLNKNRRDLISSVSDLSAMEEMKTKSTNKNVKKANLLDHHSLKHIPDKSVSDIVTSRGYKEDVRLSNLKQKGKHNG